MQQQRFSFLLFAIGYCLCGSPSQPMAQTQLSPAFTEYTRAQVLTWIDDQTFAVGRWDGSLAIFQIPGGAQASLKLLQVRIAAEGSGVEMAKAIDSRTLIFSDGSGAVGMWVRDSATSFDRYYRFTYDATYGVANSAVRGSGSASSLIVTGHADGHAIVWRRTGDGLVQERVIDLRSPNPIPSPYTLKNIRGLARWRDEILLSASEDGDVTAFNPLDGRIVFRQRFNPSAQRGLNSLSVDGDKLMVANCSVGAADKNLWLFEITASGLELLDSVNLVRDTSLPQSFDFDAQLYEKQGTLRFFSSTQEGLLWEGHVDGKAIKVDATGTVDSAGAAILELNPSGSYLATAAQQVFLFRPD